MKRTIITIFVLIFFISLFFGCKNNSNIAFIIEGNYPLTTVVFNGVKYFLIVDTGSSHSVIYSGVLGSNIKIEEGVRDLYVGEPALHLQSIGNCSINISGEDVEFIAVDDKIFPELFSGPFREDVHVIDTTKPSDYTNDLRGKIIGILGRNYLKQKLIDYGKLEISNAPVIIDFIDANYRKIQFVNGYDSSTDMPHFTDQINNTDTINMFADTGSPFDFTYSNNISTKKASYRTFLLIICHPLCVISA